MTIRSQNRKLKLNSRAIRALGLLKVLQNYQKRNKDFMKKNRTPKNEETYKTYKNLFETIKRRSKKNFYSEKLQKKEHIKCTENKMAKNFL